MSAALQGSAAPFVTASLSGRRWFMAEGEPRIALGIAQGLGLPEILGRLLAGRGIDIAGAPAFLAPTLRALMPDPSCLRDMDRVATRMADAVARAEQVAVFGDYDVDGACAGALLARVLRRLGCSVISYVPDRLTEGYGPNAPALRALVARGATLVICVDCGSAADEALAAITGRADVLVLDHHVCDHVPPTVLAMVNPNRADDCSGLGTLCASAVAFLACIACLRVLRQRGHFTEARPAPDLMALLDLVALATVCDMMPLTGLNRALVTQGLKVMARGERPGLTALLAVAQVVEAPTAMSCGFALGPRINAAGRIADAALGLELLLCEDMVDAHGIASTLDAVNRQRQHVEAGILQEAMGIAETQIAQGHPVLLIGAAQWHPGVVGIVAGRIKERFNRPTCVAAMADGLAKGSGRSVGGLDLGAAIVAARQAGLLLTGGGHAMACGFSLKTSDMEAFHLFLDQRMQAATQLPEAPDLLVEGCTAASGMTVELARQIGRLAPFGQANAEPLMLLANVRVAHAERIGRDLLTLRLQLEGEGGTRVKAMLFRTGDTELARTLMARDGRLLHLAGHLRAETWNGRVTACLFVADVAVAGRESSWPDSRHVAPAARPVS